MKNVAIGIDIGGTNTVFGIVDEKGNCIAKDSISTLVSDEPEFFFKFLSEKINEILHSISENVNVKGIGVGVPNGNYNTGNVEFAPNLRWKGIVKVVEILRKYFTVPIYLTNDANAAAIGEMVYGSAKGMKDFIFITLGTGLGSGIVSNGKLIVGHDGFAGEIGHTIYDVNGRQCGCGRKGCLETYCSATGIKKTVLQMLSESNEPSELRKFSSEQLTAQMISVAAKNGDKIANDAFEFTGKILGLKLADAVAYTNPEAIFLFGGLANAGDLIFAPTKKYMEENLLYFYKNKVQLLPSGLDDNNAAILGASALIW